jgi:hypothetical protein
VNKHEPPTVGDFAREIVAMERRMEFLECEVDRLREIETRYHELLDQSVKHGEQMMVGWLNLLTSDKVEIKP